MKNFCSSDPENAKFYGDIQDKITGITTDLIFFELELNKIEEADLARGLEAPALARYKPWLDDLRKDKPYQLEEQLERLFHEKSITSHSAWSRLFSETMTGLRFEVEGEKGPLIQGVTLVLSQLLDILRRFHITPIDAQGQPFDPNIALA